MQIHAEQQLSTTAIVVVGHPSRNPHESKRLHSIAGAHNISLVIVRNLWHVNVVEQTVFDNPVLLQESFKQVHPFAVVCPETKKEIALELRFIFTMNYYNGTDENDRQQ